MNDWMMVPTVPTEAMLQRAWTECSIGGRQDYQEFWATMLAAAPEPAEQKPAPDVSALVEALNDAATSLETISRAAGREDHGLDTMTEVRGYANSRAMAAHAALAAYRKQGASHD